MSLYGAQATDAWLGGLAAMKTLRLLDLNGGNVRDVAIERLHGAQPQVKIFLDGMPKCGSGL